MNAYRKMMVEKRSGVSSEQHSFSVKKGVGARPIRAGLCSRVRQRVVGALHKAPHTAVAGKIEIDPDTTQRHKFAGWEGGDPVRTASGRTGSSIQAEST